MRREGQLPESVAALRQASERMPGETRAWIQLGVSLLENEQAEQAREVFRKALELAPGNQGALVYLALCASDLKNDGEFAEIFEQVSPANQILPTLKALHLLRSGQALAGLEVLEIPPAPASPPWRRPELSASGPFVSRLLLEAERYLLPVEIPMLERSKALDTAPPPEEPPPAVSLTRGCQGWMEKQRGSRALEKAIFCRYGDLRAQLFWKAIEHMRRARQLDPNLFRCHYNLGEAILFAYSRTDMSRGELLEALDCFLRSWHHEGPNPYLHYYLGKCHQYLGRVEAAVTYYNRAIERFTKLPEVHYGLAQCHLLLGDAVQARRWLLRVTSADLQMSRDRLLELSLRLHEGAVPEGPPLPLPTLPPEPEKEPELETEMEMEKQEPVLETQPAPQPEPEPSEE